MIELKNITKRIGAENKLFDGLSLSFSAGERIALEGENGAGKSTVLNIIAGLDCDYTGTVLRASDRIGYVPQDYRSTLLPWYSVRKNILLAAQYRKASLEEAEKKLEYYREKLGIDFSFASYPHRLSGGQQQLVCILRTLITQQDIYLFDEIYAAIDPSKRARITELLQEVIPKKAIVISTSHRTEEHLPFITKHIQLDTSAYANT